MQTVLIVDNSRFVTDLVQRWVKSIRRSASIVRARHGAEALTIMSRVKVDLIIATVESPVDGVQLSEKVKKDHPEVVVILVSAKGEPKNHKADAFVNKPVFKKELSATIIRLVPFVRPPAKGRKAKSKSSRA